MIRWFWSCAGRLERSAKKNIMLLVRYTAGIQARPIELLFRALENAIKEGVAKATVLISSTGGKTRLGSEAYDYLKALPIELTFYNVGVVDSAAVPFFLSAGSRFATPNSRFLIHPSKWTLRGDFTRDQLAEKVATLDEERDQYLRIYRKNLKVSEENLLVAVDRGTIVTPGSAIEWGIVNGVNVPEIPPNSTIYSISDTP